MSSSFIDRQSELPRSVPLFRYVPERVHFSWQDWNPALVRSVADLPQYLILGELDPSTFERSGTGWLARWQGTEADTHFDVEYDADLGRCKVRQTWFGLDGGYSSYAAKIPLERVIGQALYSQFPRSWDVAAKSLLESAYQVTLIEQPENAYSFCGIPDGALRTIVFPIAVHNLRPVRKWMRDVLDESRLAYPINVEAKLIFQAINYLEGKSHGGISQAALAFNQAVAETGLAPQGFPVREVASDGSAAWTLRRECYFLFISLPFAGLTDFLSRMASANGPIRSAAETDLRFELRPIVMPAGFEALIKSLALWDNARTTRSLLMFTQCRQAKDVPKVEDAAAAEGLAPAALAKAEAISSDIVTAIEQIFQRMSQGGGSCVSRQRGPCGPTRP